MYFITCKVCGSHYVGSTSTKLGRDFNNHKSCLRAHSRKSAIDKKSDDFTYKRFHGLGHHGLQDVGVQIIDLVNGKRNVL